MKIPLWKWRPANHWFRWNAEQNFLQESEKKSIQSNLSNTATLGTEENGRCEEVTVRGVASFWLVVGLADFHSTYPENSTQD